jgi:hypothetical protein
MTVVGTVGGVRAFELRSRWREHLGARHVELYENSPGRMVWWFEASSDRTAVLRTLAKGDVILLLFYEEQNLRECGLAKAVRGRLDLCHFGYGE